MIVGGVAVETDLSTRQYFTKGPRPGPLTCIVIHWWGSESNLSFAAIKRYLSDTPADKQTSIHWIAQGSDADGTKRRRYALLTPEADIAWQAGNWAVNQTSIGIECRPHPTDEDYLAVAALVADIRQRKGDLPLKGHGTVSLKVTACPGDWDLDRLDRLSRSLSAPAPAPASTTPTTSGSTMGTCVTTSWRGSDPSAPAVKACAHSVPRLNAWAKSTGNVLLKALPGCGTYQTSTKASAGTHAGGGAIDLNLNGLSYADKRMVESRGRQHYGLVYYRWAITGLWTNHGHGLDSTCPNLSKTAAAQFPLLKRGLDALASNGPDTGDRTYVDQIMADFANRLTTAVGGVAQAVSNAARVKDLQKAVAVTPVDGIWGAVTERALAKVRLAKGPRTPVVAIQKGLGVPADGVWGPVTDAKYLALRGLMYRPSQTSSPAVPAVKPKVYNWLYPYQRVAGFYPYPGKKGASYYGPSNPKYAWYSGKASGGKAAGTDASGGLTLPWIQGHINRIRRCVGLAPNSRYDAALVTAVKAWQKKHGLPQDGIVGPKTWAAMAKSKGQGK